MNNPPVLLPVLSLNLFDPTGRSWLPIETNNILAQGCHPLSVVTGIVVQDTANIEEMHTIDEDIIDEQARCLLEDIAPKAIKVGACFSPDSCQVIAQLLADYRHIPSIVVLGPQFLSQLDDSDEGVESTIAGLLTIVASQAHIVIIDANYIDQWIEARNSIPDYMEILYQHGVEHCVVLGLPESNTSFANILFNRDSEPLHLPSVSNMSLSAEYMDIFSTHLMCLVAHRLPLPIAATQSIRYMNDLYKRQHSIGMGRSLPLRYAQELE